MRVSTRRKDGRATQRGESVLIAVLVVLFWLAPIMALTHKMTSGSVPGSDICRTPAAKTGAAKTTAQQPVADVSHPCPECCCSAVRLGGGLPSTSGWFFLPAAAPLLTGDDAFAPRPLAWRDLAPPPRAPPPAAGIDATETRIG